MSDLSSGEFQFDRFITKFTSWYKHCPLFTKSLLHICFILGVFHALSSISFSLILTPVSIAKQFQMWRFVTSPLAFPSFLQLLFGLWAYLPMSEKLEHQWGTIKTLFDFFLKNFMIYAMFVLLAYFLKHFYDFTSIGSYGLWELFFVYLARDTLENPHGVSTVLCLPVKIRNYYHPFALWALFCFVMEEVLLNHLIAMFVGYLHFAYLDNIYHQIFDSNRLNNWSKLFIFSKVKAFSNYIDVGGDQCGDNVDFEPSTDDAETADSLDDLPQSPEIKPVDAKGVSKKGSKSLSNV